MIFPRRLSFMCGATASVTMATPFRLTSKVQSQSSAFESSRPSYPGAANTPALLTKMSIFPKCPRGVAHHALYGVALGHVQMEGQGAMAHPRDRLGHVLAVLSLDARRHHARPVLCEG